jgi:hypothetical protein
MSLGFGELRQTLSRGIRLNKVTHLLAPIPRANEPPEDHSPGMTHPEPHRAWHQAPRPQAFAMGTGLIRKTPPYHDRCAWGAPWA